MGKKTGTTNKQREAAVAAARDLPDDVLEAEMKRRSAAHQRIERLVAFLKDPEDGYKQYGDPIGFGGEDFIALLQSQWHLCLLSGAVEFSDLEKWLRRVLFRKEDSKT